MQDLLHQLKTLACSNQSNAREKKEESKAEESQLQAKDLKPEQSVRRPPGKISCLLFHYARQISCQPESDRFFRLKVLLQANPGRIPMLWSLLH